MTRRRTKYNAYEGLSIGDILNQTANNIDSGNLTGFDLIKFRPNVGPQEQFIKSEAFEVLYGGAAGGGKAQPWPHSPQNECTSQGIMPRFSDAPRVSLPVQAA